MIVREYSWAISGCYDRVDPNQVGQEFEKLGDNLTPEAIVDVARDENNIMHNLFEWNDTIAAEQFRRTQARQIICNLQVNIVTKDDTPKKVRAFVSLRRNTGYKSMEAVVNDVDQYQLLLEKAYRELYALKCKYETLEEIQSLLANIPEIA